MNPIFAAALEVQRWGEPRLTQDVDLTVISGFGNENAYADQFLSAFSSRIPDRTSSSHALGTRGELCGSIVR